MPPRRAKDSAYVDPDNLDQSDSEGSDFNDDEGPSAKAGRKGKNPIGGSSGKKVKKSKGKGAEQPYAWEASYTRSWDAVREDEGGSLQLSVEELLARNRRQRLLQPTAAIRRTIIRHLILLLDLSSNMMDRDLRPNRFDLTLEYSRAFVAEWFDQNPLGQIGVVGMRAGIGERIREMSGNPQEVIKSLSDRTKLEPAGEPSLQNAIEMARASMRYVRSYCIKLYCAELT
ncbi:hypothetical protein FRC02_011069 [Tulasnella sp. 418]|nr:hypothetical protein FRC02_011069 [Tulasnella sp. 418]